MCARALSLSYSCVTVLWFSHLQTGSVPGVWPPRRVWALVLAAQKKAPSFYTATLISNMQTVKGRGPAAGQWLQVHPFGLGKTTAWSLLLLLGGLRPRPCLGTPPPPPPVLGPGISGLWVRIPPRLMELSSHEPQARVPALSLFSVHCGPCGHTPCLQLWRDLGQ